MDKTRIYNLLNAVDDFYEWCDDFGKIKNYVGSHGKVRENWEKNLNGWWNFSSFFKFLK